MFGREPYPPPPPPPFLRDRMMGRFGVRVSVCSVERFCYVVWCDLQQNSFGMKNGDFLYKFILCMLKVFLYIWEPCCVSVMFENTNVQPYYV